jgi:hypothetical protein
MERENRLRVIPHSPGLVRVRKRSKRGTYRKSAAAQTGRVCEMNGTERKEWRIFKIPMTQAKTTVTSSRAFVDALT